MIELESREVSCIESHTVFLFVVGNLEIGISFGNEKGVLESF